MKIRSNPVNRQGYENNNLPGRHRTGWVWKTIFKFSTLLGMLSLLLLAVNIVNQAFGYIAVTDKIDPETLSIDSIQIEEMNVDQLIQVLQSNLTKNRFRTLDRQGPLAERSVEELYKLVITDVVKPQIEETWSLFDSITKQTEIRLKVEEKYPKARLVFTSWLTRKFILSPQDSEPLTAGVRTAILGSLWIIAITIGTALPIGIGAAIYLEEYATSNWINRIIQININNLAGVPSIIYGMLGLTIFVRGLSTITSGAVFGLTTDSVSTNGRTILSAGLTMALLVLPVFIINSQEAIRAVPSSLRMAGFGLGATKWQVIWAHVLPNALPGILTGTILSISRAMGETAPLIVVGAQTYITFDPSGPFSTFTSLPIQIYQWTARAQGEFRNLAAAAILVLLLMLLSLNAAAIFLRNHYSRRY